MKRDFTDEMKEQLLDAVDEEYSVIHMGKPEILGQAMPEHEIDAIAQPWYMTYTWEQAIINMNYSAKQKIETVWEDVYNIADTYKERFDIQRVFADVLVEKLNLIADILSSGKGSGDYGRLEQLPQEIMKEFAEINSKISSSKYDMVYEGLVFRDSEGNIIGYDYDMLYSILNKNPDEISWIEYQAIAMLYIGENSDIVKSDMHIEFQNAVLNSCITPSSRDYDIQYYGNPSTSIRVDYYEKNDKLIYLYKCMTNAEVNFYKEVHSTDDLTEIQESGIWTRIEQSKTTFAVLCQKEGDFSMLSRTYVESAGNYYYQEHPLMLTRDDEGRIVLNYFDDGSIIPNGGLPTSQKYSEFVYDNKHSVRISKAMLGSSCNEFCESDSIDLFVEECGIEITYDDAIFESGKDIGKYALGKVFDKNNLKFNVGIFEIGSGEADLVNGLYNNYVDAKNYENNYDEAREGLNDSLTLMNYADYYNLGVVQVVDEHAGTTDIDYKVILGIGDPSGTKPTYKVIDNVNEKLALQGEDVINEKDVLKLSENVKSAHEKIKQECGKDVSIDIDNYYSN